MKRLISCLVVGVALIAGSSAALDQAQPGHENAADLLKLDGRKIDPWGPAPALLAQELPDFQATLPETRGPAGPAVSAWQRATVVVVIPNGFGSGAIISPDGWVLTNYHVVDGPIQEGASRGESPVVVQVLTCEVGDHGARRRPGSLPARVYRADPTRDLALLKIDGPAPEGTWPYLPLHKGPVDVQGECYAVGSQQGGLPWAVRHGEVVSMGRYPYGFTELMVSEVDSAALGAVRQRLNIIITSCEVSSGDSGGPLVNAEGELIGLTFATPTNLSMGAVGWHIAGEEIAAFISTMPEAPEGAPFDPLMGGMAAVQEGRPEFHLLTDMGEPAEGMVVPLYQQQGEETRVVATALFIDFGNRNGIDPKREPQPGLFVPAGLWGMGAPGGFRFDAFLVCRADHVLALGYAGADGNVDDIRIDKNRDGLLDHRWRRHESQWTLERQGAPVALIDAMRLGGSRRADMIDSIVSELMK